RWSRSCPSGTATRCPWPSGGGGPAPVPAGAGPGGRAVPAPGRAVLRVPPRPPGRLAGVLTRAPSAGAPEPSAHGPASRPWSASARTPRDPVTPTSLLAEGGSTRMSHIVTVQTRVHDPAAVAAACQRLRLPVAEPGTAELFSGAATGLIVRLPGWQYPAVIDTLTGAVRYDNYGGRWGDQQELDRFLQTYAVERVKLEARKKGYRVSEQALQDGSVQLQVVEAA